MKKGGRVRGREAKDNCSFYFSTSYFHSLPPFLVPNPLPVSQTGREKQRIREQAGPALGPGSHWCFHVLQSGVHMGSGVG